MTNYDERLYEIIDKHRHDVDMDFSADIRHYKNTNETVDGITSLTKELVAEAKPLLKERTASTEFTTWDRKTKVVKTFESETDPGFNKAINEFEQNLLKALE